jgi:hypothetical protein
MRAGPSFFQIRGLNNSASRLGFLNWSQALKGDSFDYTLGTERSPACTQNPGQIRAVTAEFLLLCSNLTLTVKVVVKEMVSNKFIQLNETILCYLRGGEKLRRYVQGLK